MKTVSFLKVSILTAIVLVLVLIGLNNSAPIDFKLPPVLAGVVTQPAALMYFGFFAVGVVTGAILCIPGKPRGKSGKPA
jgi:branched-subunit amino acid transport protein